MLLVVAVPCVSVVVGVVVAVVCFASVVVSLCLSCRRLC